MKKRNRNILIVVLSIFIVLGGFAAYGVYRIYSFFNWMSSMRPETPAEIKEARILKGSDLLTKTEFFKLDQSGLLDTIGKGAGIEDEEERQKFIQMQTAKGIYNFSDLKVIGYEIVAVGEFGAYIFELNGTLKRQVAFDLVKEKIKIGPYEQDHFDSDLDDIRIVQLEKEKYGFLSFSSTGGARVFDQNGRQIWSYGKEEIDLGILVKDEKERDKEFEKRTFVQQAAVGDLDNDGISEYIVTKRKDGIHAFYRDGKEKWFQPLDHTFANLLVMDLDNDGKNELLMLGESVRSGADGKIIREIKGDSNASVMFVEDKSKKKVIQFCNITEKRFVCADEKGVKFLDGEAPLNELKSARPTPEPQAASTPIDNGDGTAAAPVDEIYNSYEHTESIYTPRALWVTLKKDKPKYLAVIGAYIGIPRANLYIYAPDGTLVYHELLPENAETIAVLPGENGIEALLVGGKDTIWKYAG